MTAKAAAVSDRYPTLMSHNPADASIVSLQLRQHRIRLPYPFERHVAFAIMGGIAGWGDHPLQTIHGILRVLSMFGAL
jgi:hypothetical protein